MPTALITGASRGIGLEFARQLAEEGWRVHATHRGDNSRLRALAGDIVLHPLEATQPEQIAALAEKLGDEAIDLLVNNAGLTTKNRGIAIPHAEWLYLLQVNCVAPIEIAVALLDSLKRGRRKQIAFITSELASLTGPRTEGSSYAYRSSKAGLNAAVRHFSRMVFPDGIACCLLHPGRVQTDIGGPDAPVTILDSVAGMRRALESAPRVAGAVFLDWEGRTVPW